MSAFPAQRQSQRDWLAYYATLKDDEGEGESLEEMACGCGEESGEEEDPNEELDGLIDSGPVNDDEAGHKRLDASRRRQEERALQALARRFEEKAADYVESADYVDESSSRRAKQAKAAVRRARAEAQSARRAEEEEEKARAEAVQKRKHDALAALYEAYETEGLNEPSAPAVATAPPPMAMRSEERSGETGGAKKRFRIAKKASA